jgi:protein-S-isoprenylcysteine O-methyltransferase Ste14
MTNTDSAHESWWEVSEVVFGIPFLIGLALQWLAPLSVDQGIFRQILLAVGIALIAAGVGLVVFARREFAHYGQSMEPGHPIGRIVDTGVFSISRNPLYLGITITLAGIAFVFNVLWVLVLTIPAVILCHYVLIAPEERYLKNKFGHEYLAYAESVRRWIGRK